MKITVRKMETTIVILIFLGDFLLENNLWSRHRVELVRGPPNGKCFSPS